MPIRSNQAYMAGAKQTAKGTPNTTMAWRTWKASDDRVSPRADFAALAETDSSRDQANSEKVGGGAEGGFQHYVRDSFFHKMAEAVLGDKATTGTTNYTHTSVGSDALSYYTLRQMLGATLFEQFADMIAGEWTVSAEAAGFLTSQVNWLGRTPTRVAVEWGSLPATANDAVYNFNDAAVSIGGVASALVRSFTLTVTNNLSLMQTDDFIPSDVWVGTREVSVGFDMYFDNLDHYNQFHYGSTGGLTQVSSTFVTDLNFLFTKSANNSIEFDLDAVNFEEYPVAPDPGGDPIIVPVRARARRNGVGLVKVVTKNQTAT